MIMVPLVCLVAVYIGIAGGLFVSYPLLEIGVKKYFTRSFDAIHTLDVVTGLIKVEAFAILVALIACHEGLSTNGGVVGVGRATTRSVVRSIVAIILCDLVFTALFYFL
jgi:phospholipid/cholesterol/gamma-HCH transport system permease protein